MYCANPDCHVIADDLMKGTLKLLEFDTPPEERVLYSSGGFPVCAAPTRYFWLCRKCSHMYTVRKWNSAGVILEPLTATTSTSESVPARRSVAQESSDVDMVYGVA